MIDGLGLPGYGWFLLVISIVGYFGALDINLTSCAIKFLAEAKENGDRGRQSQIFWFAALFYGALGTLVSIIVWLFADRLIDFIGSSVPDERHEIEMALRIGGIGFAIGQIQSLLTSTVQAAQRFDISARIEIVFGALTNILSVVVAMSGMGLASVILTRIVISLFNCLTYVFLMKRDGFPMNFTRPSLEVRRSMLSFSAYAYLGKLASTMHQHGDKLIVGAIGGASAVAIYSVPITLASRIIGMTSRLSAVVFPHASALATSSRMHELRNVYFTSTRYVMFINLAAASCLIISGDEFLRHWVGDQFASTGYYVLVLMTCAMLFDSSTNTPSLVNDALGNTKVTGGFAVLRGVFGVLLIYLCMREFGLVGAAAAHLIASFVLGGSFLVYAHGRTIPAELDEFMKVVIRPLIPAFLMIVFFTLGKRMQSGGVAMSVMISIIALIGLMVYGYFLVLAEKDRVHVVAMLQRMTGRNSCGS